MIEQVRPHIVSRRRVAGVSKGLEHQEGWQVRPGGTWLVTRDTESVTLHKVGSDRGGGPLFASTYSVLLADIAECQYVTPSMGGVVISLRDAVSSRSVDGEVKWSYSHSPWEADSLGQGACAETPDGRYVVAAVPGDVDSNGHYPGDRCVLLDSITGAAVHELVLSSFSASYAMQYPSGPGSSFLLSAGQGQDASFSWWVRVENDRIVLDPIGEETEQVTGSALPDGNVLLLEVGREYLKRGGSGGEADSTAAITADAEEIIGVEESCIVGRPGFVDDSYVIVAMAEEWWSEETEHFLLDARTLEARRRVQYQEPVGPEPLALADGTWLTTGGDEVCRWALEAVES